MGRHKNDTQYLLHTRQGISLLYEFGSSVFCRLCFTLIFLPFLGLAQSANKSIQQGNTAYRQADFASAIKEYQKALSADDKNATAQFNMANAFQHSNEVTKALQAYDGVIKNTPDADLKSKAYYNKGLSQLLQKDLAGAMESFKQSLRLKPGDNEARENLEKARQELKQQQPQQNKQDDKKPPQSPKQQQKQKQQQKMNQQMMEQKFKELQEQEKQLQKELQKQRTNQPDPEKDW